MEVAKAVDEDCCGFHPKQENIDADDIGDDELQLYSSKQETDLVHEDLQACHSNMIHSGS